MLSYTDILECPNCKKDFEQRADCLKCTSCGGIVPIIDGVPRFLRESFDKGFNQRWTSHPKPQATTDDIFWKDTGWADSDLAGCVVLDAGCGCGRFAAIAERAGAQVVAVDGSTAAIKATRQNSPRALCVQANLLDLPLKDNIFDKAFSIGVLHHTGDTRDAFLEVARTVKLGGSFAVWVYADPAEGDEDRRVAQDFLYEITKNCPPDKLHEACEKYVPKLREIYAKAGANWDMLRATLRVSTSPDLEEAISDSHDWHTPQFRDWHSKDEVCSWFTEDNFKVDRIGAVPTSVRGVKL